MSTESQLAKIVEFLYRTQIIDHASRLHGWKNKPTEIVTEYLMLLPIDNNWDVDKAVEEFKDFMDRDYAITGPYQEFDANTFLCETFELAKDRNLDTPLLIKGFNEKFFGFDVDLEPLTTSEQPPEPGM